MCTVSVMEPKLLTINQLCLIVSSGRCANVCFGTDRPWRENPG